MPKNELLSTTAMPNSPIPTMRPTPSERAMGRFMRAPDHDGGDGDGGAPAGEGGSDANSNDSGGDGEADGGQDGGDDTSVLGGAKSGEGAGGEGGDGSADGEGGDADAGKDGEGEGDGPPEAYDLKLVTMTKDEDGKDVETAVEMDKALVEKAAPVLKDLGLNNDQANKIVSLVPEVQARMAEQQANDHAAMKAQWARDAEADPEIGGKNWKETQTLAAKALDHFGAPQGSDFRKLLDDTGLGNHPVMISMFRKIGQAVREDDKIERDTTNPQGKKDRLETLYPEDVPTKK